MAQALRVAVTGATGNIGTSVVEALTEDERVGSILGIARRWSSWSTSKLEQVTADVSEDDLTPLFADVDVVIHLAWLFQPTRDPLTTWRVNVLGSVNTFAAAASNRVGALIYASSIGAYSPAENNAPVTESWPTHGWPDSAYTREKAYVERVLDGVEHDNPGLRVVRMRPAFVFKKQAASEQRRLFAGPMLPGRLVRPGFVPFVPDIDGLRVQAVHSADIAAAIRVAATSSEAQGAYNIAAEPVVDAQLIGDLLGARTVRVPAGPLRAVLAAAWRARLVPATPGLFDAVRHLPVMDTSRARVDLGWAPRYTAAEAVEEFLVGLREGAGMPTPPLASEVPGGRIQEFSTGVGKRP